MSDTDLVRLLLIVASAAAGGAINSIAGGGTLLTFPALVSLGVPGVVANATCAVALVPGSLSALLGYRRELSGDAAFAGWLALPSVLGGLAGAMLLIGTPAERFDVIVPWLVLGATALFVLQRPVMRRLGGRRALGDREAVRVPPPVPFIAWQFAVSVYGGYFGAGLGILMLAALGFMGLTSIHRMNGLKSWSGMCANLVAAIAFAVSGLVDWRVAAAMTLGAIAGGYGGSAIAQRVPQRAVRSAIVVIGVAGGLSLLR